MNTSESELRDNCACTIYMKSSPKETSLAAQPCNTLFTKEDECWINKFDSEFSRKRSELAFVQSFNPARTKGTLLYAPQKDIPEELREHRMMSFSDITHYARKCAQSKGYDVSGCSGRLPGGISEVKNPGKTGDEFARFAVNKYNWDKKRKIKFLEVVRANVQKVAGMMTYLTLKAIADRDGIAKNFRAKVWFHVDGKSTLEEFMKEPRPVRPIIKRVSRPFDIFVDELRKSPELERVKYKRVLKIASAEWRSMSAEDKSVYEKQYTDAVALEKNGI